ncbi:chromodomain-helicase-DNA-binding protein 8-like isoform X2 [Lytechinus variegatus]|uniref:chromodomain-helicase-DNA-binding protein 8-like isoform X2 n=1 Tax=Lytechinus variegatus TaxID=7654 RepID=UPI001BB27976|nr:chromodomain-helicase-DNA-binding protein 8-like isoform X2 [Lytechinus variegatus]
MDEDPGPAGTPSSSGDGDKDDSVPNTHGLQLLAKLASPAVVSQSEGPAAPPDAAVVMSPGGSAGSVSPRGQNKVTIGVQQVSNIQGKTIKQGAQTFYITTPATSGNLVGKPVQLKTSSAGKPYLIQTSGGLVTTLQAGQSGQKVLLTSRSVQQPSSNMGTSILSTVPTTSTVQATGKPIMVTQQNQPQIKFVTKTSPTQQPNTSQPMKVQLRVKDSTILQKLQQSGQVMTLGAQGKPGDGKQQPIRLVLPGSSAGNSNAGQIQLVQTQQGLQKVITLQQPKQAQMQPQGQPQVHPQTQPQQTVQISQPQNKAPVQFAVVQQPGGIGAGTRLVVVSQPSSSTSTTAAVTTSPAGKSSLISQPGTIRIVIPPQSQVGDASKSADGKASTTVSAQNIYQILANQKVQIPRVSNVSTLNQGQVKLIQSSGGNTVKSSQGQTCIIVPSTVSSTGGKSIAIASSPKSPGSSNVPAINRISPIRQGNTVVHIVSGAGGQQIATVVNSTAMQPKPGVQSVCVTSPKTVSLSPRGQGKPVSGAAVKLFTTITTTAAGSIKQLTNTGQTVTSKVISLAPTVTTQSLSTVPSTSPQKITINKKVINLASVLPKTGVSREKTDKTVTVNTVPGVASTSGASTSSQQQKLVKILPTKAGQKPTQLVILVNQSAANIGEEVKEIGEELNKLQNQPKTQETVDKLKQLQARLQKLQVAAQLSAKAKNQDADEPLPTNEKERKKAVKQRKLQDKANRIIAEAVAKARAAGKLDIPKVFLDNEEISAELISELELEAETKKKKKDKKDRSKSKKSSKQTKEKKVKEKKLFTIKKKSSQSGHIKKLPAAAINKLKRQKRKHGEFSGESSDLDETPPPSPPPDEFSGPGIEKRRSARNTNRKRYTEDYDFNITSNDDSSSDEEKNKKKKKAKNDAKVPVVPKMIKIKAKQDKQDEDVDVEGNSEIDVVSFEPSETAKFFVDNPDESQANVIEKILASRITKKPQIPGEAQVGEIEEFYVKYRNFSYLHCEWATIEKLSADPRIFQKIKRFRLKQQANYGLVSEFDEGEYFNPDFIVVDRILDKAITKDEDSDEMVTHYLVKWASLPYEESTWELAEDVDEGKKKIYEKCSKLPSKSERQRKSRPGKSEWKKLSKSPNYKDDNVLREYQLEGVNWLTFSWCTGQSCILADEMGLGKTIQTIGFLQEIEKTGIKGPFLVLAPLSTIANWQREVESWTDMNCVVYHGGSQSRHMIAEYEMFFKDASGVRIPDVYKFQILITTYEILLADCQELSEIEWRVLVIDEAHRLKNRNCKLLEGLKILDMEHRVLLTGTPLQNNVDELFSLLNFLEPGRFRSSSQFLEDFGDLKTEGQVEKLQQLLRPMMLRRLKEDVEKNLAPKEETIIEVEMTSIQKRYYRAILEKNFSFLTKGAGSTSNLPNLMNTMMELRKCCNHPFLINGGEEQIIKEFRTAERMPDETIISVHVNPLLHLKVLIQSAGKMVLLDKLLPKLKDGGHKVLIFSQMIRCLDILEDYLIQKRYLFERIDGRVRGNMRQAAIDRFSKPDSDRFVFLLCTRAGGLGINLTAADTCIIFDSDWNPQNDIQAQARCHRIGQQKAVKVYRLITRNSYEREMFDKASMKLGLDKAVLQSMRDKEASSYNPQQALSKKEIEDLLRRGAYGAIMDDDDQSSQFCAEDIDMILQRRTQVIKHKPGQKGSSFAKASFTTDSDHTDIKIDDPDFWHKWAKRADIDPETGKEDFIIDVPRQRTKTKRFGGMDEVLDMTSDESEDERPTKPQTNTTKKTKEKREPSQRPPKKQMPCGWTRLECFRVEKGLLTFGWGRWDDILATTRFKRRLGEKDVESIARTMLMYCLQHYKGDENIKSFIWDLVTPSPDGTVKDCRNHKGLSAPVPRGRKGKKPKRDPQAAHISYDMTAKEHNLDNLLTDQGYKNHLKRHCNKVLLRVRLLYYLKQEVIGDFAEQIENMVHAKMLPMEVPVPEGDPPVGWWDKEADHSLLIGVYKHGYEKYPGIRLDPCLCFRERCGVPDHREIMAAQAKENEDFNESQLDVEGGDGLDVDDGEGDDLGDGEGGGGGDSQGSKDEGMEIAPSAIPKHLKEDPDDDSISPSSTRPSSPTSTAKTVPKLKISSIIIPTAVPGKLLFPTAPDLNTRLRRLVAAYQREHKKRQIKEQKREKKEQVKMVRLQEQMRQRELRKIENAQKWSRREEADFYRILTAFGVDKDQETGKFNWERFKRLAKLDRKYDDRMTEFYQHYYAMCLRVCKKAEEIPEGYGATPLPDNFTIEDITEERASKCLSRIDLLNKIRTQILPHPDLDERLKKCRPSMELPDWWQLGRHDKDLIVGVCRYGINRQESQHAMMNDENLCFKELKEKFPEAAAAMPVPVTNPSTPGSAVGPFQRRPGLKKPGPKKGVPRKKKPPPDKPDEASGAAQGTSQNNPLESEQGKGGLDNGNSAPQAAEGPLKFQEGEDERTMGAQEEGLMEATNEDSLDTSKLIKDELESRPDSADMSQDANSINDDLDEGLGSDDDDEHKINDSSRALDSPYDNIDTTSKVSGIDDEGSNLFGVKVESLDDNYESREQLLKEEMKYENMSDDNSNLGEPFAKADVKYENMSDDNSNAGDQLIKTETKYENMSDDNSNLGDPEQPMDMQPPPLSMLQQVLMKGGDGNHFGLVKQESGEGKGKPQGKSAKPSSTKKKEGVPKVVVPTFRWPKDRVIVHRLEQLSHLVLKDEWPGRKSHHHPVLFDPPYDDNDSPGPRGGLEHNYAGGMSSGRKRAAPALNPDGTVKKKKKKKKLMLDAQRAAQFAALMRQNQAMMAAFTSGGTLPGAMEEDPSAIADLANNTPPQSTSMLSLPPSATPSSSYHIHDTVFKAVPDFVREGRGPAEGRVVGVLDMSGKGMAKKKKKKVKVHTVKVDGKLVKIKKPVDPNNPLKAVKKKKKKHKHKVGAGSGQSTEQTTSTAASESQESQDDGASGAVTTSATPSSTTPVKKRKRLKNPVRLDEGAITGEEKVGMISRESGKRLAGKHCPSLVNLSDWLVKHPSYNVAMEWGNIVKTKGYLRDELKNRVATSKSRHILIKPNIAPAPTKLTIGGLSGSNITGQIGQRPMGGIGFPASFTGVGMGKITSPTGITVSASGLGVPSSDVSHSPSPKKKKKKTSSSPTDVKKNILPRTITVDATAAGQLAGISPFLLPNTGNVFFSPFLAQQGVLQAAGNTVTITTPSSASATSQGGIATPKLQVVSNVTDNAARKRTHSEIESPKGNGQNNIESDDSDSSDDDGQLIIKDNDEL